MRRRRQRDERGNWYLLTGLAIGLALGLLAVRAVRPVEAYIGMPPAMLGQLDKDRYRAMIAAAYVANGDVIRARARLALLQDQDLYLTLAQQAQRSLASGLDPEEARSLGLLAVAIGNNGPAATVPASSPTAGITRPPDVTDAPTNTPIPPVTVPTERTAEPTPSATAGPSPTPGTVTVIPPGKITPSPTFPTPRVTLQSTRTPTATAGAPFVLADRSLSCTPSLSAPMVQVWAVDAAGNPVPGLEVVIQWDGGEERFYTGLKPEIGLGYGDFMLGPGITYTLHISGGGQVVADISAKTCPVVQPTPAWGAWQLNFRQP